MKKYAIAILLLFNHVIQSNELQQFYEKHLIPIYDARYQLLDNHVNTCKKPVSKCLPLSVMVKQPKRMYIEDESLSRVYYAEKISNYIIKEGLSHIDVVQKKMFMPSCSALMCVAANFVEGNCNQPLSLVEVQELLRITDALGYCDWSYSNDIPSNIIRRNSDGKLVIIDTGHESFLSHKIHALERLLSRCTLMEDAYEHIQSFMEQKNISEQKLVVDTQDLDILKSQLEESRRSSGYDSYHDEL